MIGVSHESPKTCNSYIVEPCPVGPVVISVGTVEGDEVGFDGDCVEGAEDGAEVGIADGAIVPLYVIEKLAYLVLNEAISALIFAWERSALHVVFRTWTL